MLIQSQYDLYPIASLNISDYERMLMDSVVRHCYEFLRTGIMSRIGSYSHSNKKIEAYIASNVMPAIRRDLPQVLSAIFYGCSVSEMIWSPLGKALVLDKIHSASPREWLYLGCFERSDVDGSVVSVQFNSGNAVPVKNEQGIRQLIIYPYKNDFGNVFGYSIGRTIYAPYYIKTTLQKLEAIALEGWAVPKLIIKGNSFTDEGKSFGEQYAALSDKLIFVAESTEIQPITTPYTQTGSPFGSVIHRLNADIARGFYMGDLIAAESEHSSRAQASVQMKAYSEREKQIAQEVIEVVVLDQIIKTAIQLQFGDVAEVGSITLLESMAPSKTDELTVIQGLWEMGLVRNDIQEQVQWIQEKIEVPMAEYLSKNLPYYAPNGAGKLSELAPTIGNETMA